MPGRRYTRHPRPAQDRPLRDAGRPLVNAIILDDADAPDAAVDAIVDAIASTLQVQRLEHWWNAITDMMKPSAGETAFIRSPKSKAA